MFSIREDRGALRIGRCSAELLSAPDSSPSLVGVTGTTAAAGRRGRGRTSLPCRLQSPLHADDSLLRRRSFAELESPHSRSHRPLYIYIYIFIHRSGRNKKNIHADIQQENRKETQKYLSNK